MKVEAICKECGKVFVKYSYSRTSRCEACRRKNRKTTATAELSGCNRTSTTGFECTATRGTTKSSILI